MQFTSYSVTKTIPIHFIDGKCDIKFNQSHRVYITPYIMALITNDHRSGHTHMHTQAYQHLWTKAISGNQHAPGLNKGLFKIQVHL